MQIHANNLELSAGRGPVYGPLTFETDGGLTVLRGNPGSGRTSLLLTLAGRMKPDGGTLTTGGHQLPRHLRSVQKISSVAGFAGIDTLEESVTVGAALRERLAWISPWFAIVRKSNDVDVANLCAGIFGTEPIPRANTVIWDLDDTQQFLLRLVLATLSSPQVLFVDDIEQLRSTEARSVIWARLAHLAAGGTAVVVAASSLDEQLWAELEIAPQIIDMNLAPAAAVSDSETPTAQHELIKETL